MAFEKLIGGFHFNLATRLSSRLIFNSIHENKHDCNFARGKLETTPVRDTVFANTTNFTSYCNSCESRSVSDEIK